jgi:type IV secretion system protein VirD4
MTQRAGTPPENGPILLIVGVPLALVMTAALASIVAWFILGLPAKAFDPLNIPNFFWYYRGDPHVVKAAAGGLLVGGIALAITLYMLWSRKSALHGEARFATESELRRHGFRAAQGIVLGRKSGKYITFGGSEHVIVEAPTRSGKGVGIVIPNLLTWQGSVVVLDVKRENFEATAGFRAKYGQDVHLFNPTSTEARTARYNPLSFIDRGNADQVIIELQKIATMLFVAPEKGEAFWTDSARTGFIGVGAFLAQCTDTPFTIGEIYRNMTQGDVRAFFKMQLEDPQFDLSVACRSALSDFTSGADNTFAGIVQTITSKLSLWLNPLVDAATETSDFDLRALRQKPMSIYLGVSPDELDRVAPLYNLLFQQLIDLNVRSLPDATTPVPVLVILDEFARLGRASVISSAFSYVAGYGIRLLPVIQSRSQLRAVYGEHIADEIVANCGVEVAFTPKELRVANELSERIGYVGQKSITKSLTINGILANRSQSISEQRRALMLPQELMQFPNDNLLLLRGGIPPIMGAKIRYYKSRFFKARLFVPPVIEGLVKVVSDDFVFPPCKPIPSAETPPEAPVDDVKEITKESVVITELPTMFIGVSTQDRDGERVGILAQGSEYGR